MIRHTNFSADLSLRQTLDCSKADELKKLLALLPGVKMKAPRKDELVDALERYLLGASLVELWKRLGSLEQSAIAEAVHAAEGVFDPGAFHAKYGQHPTLETQGKSQWFREPTLLRLFLHPAVPYQGVMAVPRDLREKLLAFVPQPAPARLGSVEEFALKPPREWSSRRFDAEKHSVEYDLHEAPLIERLTEQAASQDLRTTLRLIDQEKLSVSSTTLLPSKASTALLYDLLREHDFFQPTGKQNKWDPEIGPIKAFP